MPRGWVVEWLRRSALWKAGMLLRLNYSVFGPFDTHISLFRDFAKFGGSMSYSLLNDNRDNLLAPDLDSVVISYIRSCCCCRWFINWLILSQDSLLCVDRVLPLLKVCNSVGYTKHHRMILHLIMIWWKFLLWLLTYTSTSYSYTY